MEQKRGHLMKKYIVLTLPVGLLAGVAISQVIPRKVNKGEVFEVVDQSGEVIWEAPTRARMLPLHK